MCIFTMNEEKRTVADVLGYIIAALLGMLMLPQIIKTHKHGHTLGLSIKTVLINTLIATIGLAYSILIGELPLLVGNIVVLTACLFLCGQWMYYRGETLARKVSMESGSSTTV